MAEVSARAPARGAPARGKSRRGPARRSVWRGPLPVAVSVAAVAILVTAFILVSRAPAPPATADDAAPVVAKATTVPPAVFDAVGSGGVAPRLTRTDAATLRTATGKPIVIYVGADYCPFCASERWSLVVALSRFGTFRDLGLTRSSPSDVYPNTATFSFRGASYASEWVELSTVETADRFGSPRERPDATQQASLDRFDPKGSIPFVSLADRYVTIGAGYPTDVLRGKDWQEIADLLHDPSSSLARAVVGNANHLTAAICAVTEGRPADVCGSSALRGLAPGR